jgi:hypothetical protein
VTQEYKYKTTFTLGALLLKEADALLSGLGMVKGEQLDLSNMDFDSIPVNSERSKKKLGNEVLRRLTSIDVEKFVPLFNNGGVQDKKLLLFYSACKAYPLIADFMLDKVLDKWYNLDYELTAYDFQSFLYKQADTHPELENLTPNTRSKMAQVVLKMLSDLGMVQAGKLHRIEYSPEILRAIAQSGDGWFLQALLLNDHEREEFLP